MCPGHQHKGSFHRAAPRALGCGLRAPAGCAPGPRHSRRLPRPTRFCSARSSESSRGAHLSRPQRQLHSRLEALLPGAGRRRRLVLAARLHRGLAGPLHLQPPSAGLRLPPDPAVPPPGSRLPLPAPAALRLVRRPSHTCAGGKGSQRAAGAARPAFRSPPSAPPRPVPSQAQLPAPLPAQLPAPAPGPALHCPPRPSQSPAPPLSSPPLGAPGPAPHPLPLLASPRAVPRPVLHRPSRSPLRPTPGPAPRASLEHKSVPSSAPLVRPHPPCSGRTQPCSAVPRPAARGVGSKSNFSEPRAPPPSS